LSAPEARFAVNVAPRSVSNRVDGVRDGVLRIRVSAAAVEGAANAALIGLLAEELGVAKRAVRIVAGATSRQKLVVVDGLAGDLVVARWPGLRV
jgi:uncharacterized protein